MTMADGPTMTRDEQTIADLRAQLAEAQTSLRAARYEADAYLGRAALAADALAEAQQAAEQLRGERDEARAGMSQLAGLADQYADRAMKAEASAEQAERDWYAAKNEFFTALNATRREMHAANDRATAAQADLARERDRAVAAEAACAGLAEAAARFKVAVEVIEDLQGVPDDASLREFAEARHDLVACLAGGRR